MRIKDYPKSIESERALLGGLLKDDDLLMETIGIVSKEDFYTPEHRYLFELLYEMYRQGQPIDLVTVGDRITREGKEKQFGGITYVLELPEQVPSTSNLTYYAKIIREKSVYRKMLAISSEIEKMAYKQEEESGELLQKAIGKFLNIIHRDSDSQWEDAQFIAKRELERYKELSRKGGEEISGIKTGFFQLDLLLSGLQSGDLIILAARPAMGKTALALNIAQKASEKSRISVGVFSLEMSKQQLVARLFSNITSIDANQMKTGKLNAKQLEQLEKAVERMNRIQMVIDDTSSLSITDLRAKAQRMKLEHPNFGLIVIDYLQLMRGENPRGQREQQIAEISRGLKVLAKELQIPIIALSQLNRSLESRRDKRPMLSDLRESGSLEQDSDVIMFIYRDEYYNPQSSDVGIAEVIIAKQRSGPTATVNLKFDAQHTRFYDPVDIEMENIMSGG